MNDTFRRFLIRKPCNKKSGCSETTELRVRSNLGIVEFQGLTRDEVACLADRPEWKEISGLGRLTEGVRVCCFREPSTSFSDERLTGFDYPLEEQGGLIEVASHRFYARVSVGAAIDVDVWFGEGLEAWISGLHVLNLFRILNAYTLPKTETLMLHSAGVVADGGAYIFVGRSGAGKSTLSALSERLGYAVLSDDINIVRADTNGGLSAVPSGFFGQFRSIGIDADQEAFPVKGLFLLEQAQRVSVGAVREAMLVSQLLVNCPFLNQAPARLAGLLDLLCEFASRVRIGRLAFRKDEDPWPLLKSFVAGNE